MLVREGKVEVRGMGVMGVGGGDWFGVWVVIVVGR